MNTKWKTPEHIMNLLDLYYKQNYNMDYNQYIAEYGIADFAHDESLTVFIISKIKEVFESKEK